MRWRHLLALFGNTSVAHCVAMLGSVISVGAAVVAASLGRIRIRWCLRVLHLLHLLRRHRLILAGSVHIYNASIPARSFDTCPNEESEVNDAISCQSMPNSLGIIATSYAQKKPHECCQGNFDSNPIRAGAWSSSARVGVDVSSANGDDRQEATLNGHNKPEDEVATDMSSRVNAAVFSDAESDELGDIPEERQDSLPHRRMVSAGRKGMVRGQDAIATYTWI